jgi:DNA repair exonuclease SbcCD nuclease subunit
MNAVNDAFLRSIRTSYSAYVESVRSDQKLKALHGFIAEQLDAKLKTTHPDKKFTVVSKGFADDKEAKVPGFLFPKNCDITILLNDEPVAVVAVKFICSNYGQNANNYLENLTGETFSLQYESKVKVHHLIIMPTYLPYFSKDGSVKKVEFINDYKLDKYRKLVDGSKNNPDQAALPKSIMVALVDTNNKQELLALKGNQTVDARTHLTFVKKDNIMFTSARHTETTTDLFSKENQEFLKNNSDVDAWMNNILAKVI